MYLASAEGAVVVVLACCRISNLRVFSVPFGFESRPAHQFTGNYQPSATIRFAEMVPLAVGYQAAPSRRRVVSGWVRIRRHTTGRRRVRRVVILIGHVRGIGVARVVAVAWISVEPVGIVPGAGPPKPGAEVPEAKPEAEESGAP